MPLMIMLFMPLLLSLTASCQKKEAPATTPASAQNQGPSQPVTVTKQAHLDANWYTKDAADLNQELDEYLELAIKKNYVEADPEAVRALVVPHAGLYYSGYCAATAYQTLLSSKNLFGSDIRNGKIDHVIILAPDHSGMTFGITLPTYTEYTTPLGTIPVNLPALEQLKTLKLAKASAKEHDTEHALEMQLPWLQKTINKFSITPLLIGNLDEYDVNQIAQELKKIITPTTLVVVTSDFTHHGASYRYQIFNEHITNYLRALDSAIIETILKPDLKAFDEILERTQATVCGKNPLKLLLALITGQHLATSLEGRLCAYYTSAHLKQAREGSVTVNVPDLVGDLADDDAAESVSYAGLVFTAQHLNELSPENQLTGFEKQALLTTARDSIENELADDKRIPPPLLWPLTSPSLNKPQGVFVTLHDQADKLRGCIGRITSLKPLYQTTQDMAIAAAFKDERFAPLNQKELATTKISITILSQPEKVFALSNIVLGKHGIILNKFNDDGTLHASSVFLPQVPVSMKWDLATTLAELSQKAGLTPEGWRECELQIFEGYEIKEEA